MGLYVKEPAFCGNPFKLIKRLKNQDMNPLNADLLENELIQKHKNKGQSNGKGKKGSNGKSKSH